MNMHDKAQETIELMVLWFFSNVQVLHLATTINTTGATAPAASLLPYYERKEVVKTFVVVTDEIENTQSKSGHM